MAHEALIQVKTALISVSNKERLVDFAKKLGGFEVELLATAGTFSVLKDSGVHVRSLQAELNLPQALSGRVKTLHSPLFAAILAKREPGQLEEVRAMGVKPIDMVVSNFYPFEKVSSDPSSSEDDLVESIDIGGPSMVRAAAKNYAYVTVVASPASYDSVAEHMAANGGRVSLEMRRRLAHEAFGITASYDMAIYTGLSKALSKEKRLPDRYFLSSSRFQEARYGENPDQQATIYSIDGYRSMTVWEQLAGDALSFNNYLDIGGAYDIVEGFEDVPVAATVKHGSISGFAFAPTIAEAYSLAHSCDPEADFGGTTIVNRKVGVEAAKLIGKNNEEDANDRSVYTEILIAPEFELDALRILEEKQKKKIRLIKMVERSDYPYDVKVLQGTVLLQEAVDYRVKLDSSRLTFPTVARPDRNMLAKLLAAWEVVRRVRSNGIVVADGKFTGEKLTHFWTIGVATFRKRNGAVKIALDNAGGRAKGAVCASDGFFPFRDGVDLLGNAGVKAVIQPGGSINDDESVKAANEYGMIMVFTHTRAFRH